MLETQLVPEGLVALTEYPGFEAVRAVQILHDPQTRGKRIGMSCPVEAASRRMPAQMPPTQLVETTTPTGFWRRAQGCRTRLPWERAKRRYPIPRAVFPN